MCTNQSTSKHQKKKIHINKNSWHLSSHISQPLYVRHGTTQYGRDGIQFSISCLELEGTEQSLFTTLYPASELSEELVSVLSNSELRWEE